MGHVLGYVHGYGYGYGHVLCGRQFCWHYCAYLMEVMGFDALDHLGIA